MSEQTGFPVQPQTQLEPPHGARLWLWQPLMGPQAGDLAARLRESLPWNQPEIRIFGRWRQIPRLQSWHGDSEARCHYSGLPLAPKPWVPELAQIRDEVQRVTGLRFNSVLANLYRDGQDAMGWHSDDEPELGPQPWIASFNLGASRRFSLRPKDGGQQRVRLQLEHDQLLLMNPAVQKYWQHSLPRTRRCHDWRINLTFRLIQDT